MKYLKMLGLAAVAAMALMAFVGAGTASATTLYVKGVAQTGSVTLSSSIASGGSAILKDTNNATVDTCKESTVTGSTKSPFSGATVTGDIETGNLTFGGCSHKTTVLKPGTLHVAYTSGDNGTVSSSGAEVTVESTIFGASCIAKTGTGTTIGTLNGKTGATEHATMTINGVIPMGLCGDANWTGSYTVTSPTGLSVGS
ncbi:MAG TPA: hypothetical protein VF125_03835 [Solirubrobacterales bacterium]